MYMYVNKEDSFKIIHSVIEDSLIFGRIAKQNPLYEMVPSVCLSVRLQQQFGLALALNMLKFIAD